MTQNNPHIHILLAEDNPGDVILMQEAFSNTSLSHTLHSATDGEKVLDFLYKKGEYTDAVTPNFIMLDLNLPKYNGYQILEKIKTDEQLKAIPTLIISSSKSLNDITKSHKSYANAYISKPPTLDGLNDMAESIVRFWFQCASLPS